MRAQINDEKMMWGGSEVFTKETKIFFVCVKMSFCNIFAHFRYQFEVKKLSFFSTNLSFRVYAFLAKIDHF